MPTEPRPRRDNPAESDLAHAQAQLATALRSWQTLGNRDHDNPPPDGLPLLPPAAQTALLLETLDSLTFMAGSIEELRDELLAECFRRPLSNREIARHAGLSYTTISHRRAAAADPPD